MRQPLLRCGLAALLSTSPLAQEPPEDELYYELEVLGWDLAEKHKVPGWPSCEFRRPRSLGFSGAVTPAESETPVTEGEPGG